MNNINFLKNDTEKYHNITDFIPFMGSKLLENNKAQVCFWVPELIEKSIPSNKFWLEVYRPNTVIDFSNKMQVIDFQVIKLEISQINDFVLGIYENINFGNRTQTGDFYWLKYEDAQGEHRIIDYLATSIPFGVFAPAEFYDLDSVLKHRKDHNYFKKLKLTKEGRLPHPVNVLELHIQYATKEGSFEALRQVYEGISIKQKSGETLSAYETQMANYTAIQPLPIQPNIEHENGQNFWQIIDNQQNIHKIKLIKSDILNWGYDIVIAASSAVNPTLLASKRPHEFLDFVETMHNFYPTPKSVILDIVYGHADNQAEAILNPHFFVGSGMYGKEMNYKHPIVRAIMLESQRRVAQYGIDGFRVDASQDIRQWNFDKKILEYDDDYIATMHEISVENEIITYKPFMIYEDGRPWPEQGWLLTQNFQEVNRRLRDSIQWSPVTFADNNPHLFGYWLNKFRWYKKMARVGSRWLTGTSNHDSVRFGAQSNPNKYPVNTFLGDKLREIIANGYNSPAIKLLEHAFMPGVPMDFIQINMGAPWAFIRNTDEKYGIKVVAEESFFVDWWLDKEIYAKDWAFPRLKKRGFQKLDQLKKFKYDLLSVINMTDYDLVKMLAILNINSKKYPIPTDEKDLKKWASEYMEDVFELCNVTHYEDQLKTEISDFYAKVRQFRIENPWLRNNLKKNEVFSYFEDTEGAVVYYGMRYGKNKEKYIFTGNMEGYPVRVNIEHLPIKGLLDREFTIILQSPNGVFFDAIGDMYLANGAAVLLKFD